MSAERRLDEAALALGRARPRLDEVTRARVAARVEAALAGDGERASAPARRRLGLPLAVAVGGGLATAAVIAWLAVGRGERAIGAPDDPSAPAAGLIGLTRGAAPPLTAPIDVAAGDSRQVALGDATITVFGPGHLAGAGDRADADAAAVVIDRPRGLAPLALRYHGAEVIVTQATFALDRGRGVRVTVMRGELTLRCEAAARVVRAGESDGCAPPTAPAAPPSSPVSPVSPVVPPVERAPAPTTTAVTTSAAPRPWRRPATAPTVAVAPPGPAAAPTTPPPAPPPAPAPAPIEEPVASSAAPDLYPLAESAMRRGDHVGARAALDAVIAAAPGSLDAAAALLDLARLAHQDHDDVAARAYLARLDVHPRRAAVAAPAARLRAELTGR